MNPGARAYVLPCIAGHVGADTAGVILAEGPHLVGRRQPRRRRRNERRDRAREPGAPARGLEPDGAGVRGRADQLRAARGAGRDRAGSHRSRDARAARQGRRLRRLVGRARRSREAQVTGVCGSGIVEVVAELHLAGVLTTDGTIDGALAARTPTGRPRRPDVLVRPLGRRAGADDHAERRPADPARQGARSTRAAACSWSATASSASTAIRLAGRVRRPHRPGPRARARPRARLRPGAGHLGRQRRGHRARGSRCSTAAPATEIEDVVRSGREGRDGGRAALPGALRATRWRSRTTSTRTRGSGQPSRSPPRRTARERRRTDVAPPPQRPPRGGRHERDTGPAKRRARRAAGGAAPRPRRARAVPHADAAAASRSCRRRACRSSRRTPTRILEEVGIEFHDAPDALELFAGRGRERRRRARPVPARPLPLARPGDGAARSSPRSRGTARTTSSSAGDGTIFAPAYGSPFVRDLDGGRRYGTIEDFRNFVKLAYASPWLHHSGGTVCEPVDVPVNKRHFDMVYAHIRYSDKPFMGSVTRPERARGHRRDGADRVRRRLRRASTRVVFSLINANSPLVWDAIDARRGAGVRRGEPGA